MVEYLCVSVGRHEQFLRIELDSIASMYGETIEWQQQAFGASRRFYLLRFSNRSAAACIVSRSVLLIGMYEIVAEAIDLVALTSAVLSRSFPHNHSEIENDTFFLDLKHFGKRIRTCADRQQLLRPFLRAIDLPALVSSIRTTCHQTTIVLSVLIDTKKKNFPNEPSRCFLGILTATGLSSSSGGNAGRSGSGISAHFALHRRPYTGLTTMDPELSFVMANIARITAADLVMDPFAGSCGILLACSYFKATTFGSDISPRIFLGDGVGRNVASNFLMYNQSTPDVLVMDIANMQLVNRQVFDAIVCDPPYGVRTFRSDDKRTSDVTIYDQYCVEIFQLASRLLTTGGRLLFWLCLESNGEVSSKRLGVVEQSLVDISSSFRLKLICLVEQDVALSKKNQRESEWNRILVVVEKPELEGKVAPKLVLKNSESNMSNIIPMFSSSFSRSIPWTTHREENKGAKIDIWRAAWLGDISASQEYFNAKGDINQQELLTKKTPLVYAAGFNHISLVQWLLENHADPNIYDKEGITALCQACRHGHNEVVALLLKYNADPCYSSEFDLKTPAYWAASYGHSICLRELFSVCPDSITLPGPGGQNALHRSAERGSLESIQLLLQLNESYAATLDFCGRTFLHWASRNGHCDIIEHGLLHCDTSVVDFHGDSLLHEAAQYGRVASVYLLLEHGLSVSKKNKSGKTPVDLCQNPSIKQLFLPRTH